MALIALHPKAEALTQFHGLGREIVNVYARPARTGPGSGARGDPLCGGHHGLRRTRHPSMGRHRGFRDPERSNTPGGRSVRATSRAPAHGHDPRRHSPPPTPAGAYHASPAQALTRPHGGAQASSSRGRQSRVRARSASERCRIRRGTPHIEAPVPHSTLPRPLPVKRVQQKLSTRPGVAPSSSLRCAPTSEIPEADRCREVYVTHLASRSRTRMLRSNSTGHHRIPPRFQGW